MTTATATPKKSAPSKAQKNATKASTPLATELPALSEAKQAALTKSIEKFLTSEARVTLVRRKDGKEFTGQLVRREDGTFSVRTGQRGRPVSLTVNDISKVTRAAA